MVAFSKNRALPGSEFRERRDNKKQAETCQLKSVHIYTNYEVVCTSTRRVTSRHICHWRAKIPRRSTVTYDQPNPFYHTPRVSKVLNGSPLATSAGQKNQGLTITMSTLDVYMRKYAGFESRSL